MQVLSALEAAMEDCGNIIVDLFKTRPTNAAVKEVLNNHNHSEDLPYKVLKLVMAHFSEDVGGLIVQADVSLHAFYLDLTLTLTLSHVLVRMHTTDEISH